MPTIGISACSRSFGQDRLSKIVRQFFTTKDSPKIQMFKKVLKSQNRNRQRHLSRVFRLPPERMFEPLLSSALLCARRALDELALSAICVLTPILADLESPTVSILGKESRRTNRKERTGSKILKKLSLLNGWTNSRSQKNKFKRWPIDMFFGLKKKGKNTATAEEVNLRSNFWLLVV